MACRLKTALALGGHQLAVGTHSRIVLEGGLYTTLQAVPSNDYTILLM